MLNVKIRDYQERIIVRIRNEFARGAKRVGVMAPTGSGKTIIGAQIVDMTASRKKRVAFVCDRIELIEQTSARFNSLGISHGVVQPNFNYEPWKTVQVASIQTIARRGIADVDLVIFDEFHTVYKTQLEMMKNFSGVFFIGLSATPFTRGLGRHWESLIVETSVSELIREGHLVPFTVFGPPIDLSNVSIQKGEFVRDELGDAVDKPKLVADIVSTWLKRGEDRPTICFATNIAHSKHIVSEFQKYGISSAHVDAYSDTEERRDTLARFKRGEIKVVSSVDILTKGFDHPEASCLVVALPTRSLIRHVQQVGRVLRPAAGKKDAIILDHAGNTERLGFVTDELPAELDMGKRKEPKKHERKESLPKPCPQCHFVKPAKTYECPQCGFKPERRNEVETAGGELHRYETADTETKERWYREMLGWCEKNSKRPGMAFHAYQAKFGMQPASRFCREPLPPTEMVSNFMRHKLIAFAKSKERKPVPTTCRYCGSSRLVQGKGAGPHYARLNCGDCGKFIVWLPKPDGVAREH